MDDRLPGEFDEETQREAMKAAGLRMFESGLPALDDGYLTAVLALCHEEWEKRTGDRWVVAE